MSLLDRLFGGFFKKNDREQQTPVDSGDFMERWERKRKERIAAAENDLKPWIIDRLIADKTIDFTWESGNDEAFVTFTNHTDQDENLFMELEGYVVDTLQIPDAGEFAMTGKGSIYLADKTVRIRHASVLKYLTDYNEETEEEIWGEEETDSGDTILFSI